MSNSLKTKLSQAREKALASHFMALCGRVGIPVPEQEYHFASPRRWRIDFAWPAQLIALEVEGGVWTKGRHTRGAGFMSDIDKYNRMASLGYRLFRVVPGQLCDVQTFRMVGNALGVKVAEIGAIK